MEREEHIRLVGEQTLLRKELRELDAEQVRDIKALRDLAHKIEMNEEGWFEHGEQLLKRLHERGQRIMTGYERFRQLMKRTGFGLQDM